jgi:glycosyltransferase involved in cell wall biosynthesis
MGRSLSGVGVYSREILNGLAGGSFADSWDWFYRSQRYWRARREPKPAGVTRRFLADSWGNRSAALFHGLNQRLPRRRFKLQVSTFHDLFVLTGDYSTKEFRERFALQAREAAAASDLVIAVSAFTGKQVEELLHVPASRIRVIHHGVVPRQIPVVAREPIVLCAGAIQRRKNQAALVKAFRALPAEWKLLLAGSQGFEAAETLDAIAESPARDRIVVTGYISDEDLAGWYAKASIFAFPSLDEGFGMPVIEAMAAGIPVITSRRSSLPEVAGDAALLVDPTDVGELESALLALALDAGLRNDLIAKGRRHSLEFCWSKAVEQTASVYVELLR